jgi:hypothetical protein
MAVGNSGEPSVEDSDCPQLCGTPNARPASEVLTLHQAKGFERCQSAGAESHRLAIKN